MSMCGICWFDGRALTDERDDLRVRVSERDARIAELEESRALLATECREWREEAMAARAKEAE